LRFRPSYDTRRLRVALPAPGTHPVSRPYLMRALQAVEGRLDSMYSRQLTDGSPQRIAVIQAASDPESPVWSDIMQIHYLENAREGLLSALQAMRPARGRPQ
jgi:hypothetical protein